IIAGLQKRKQAIEAGNIDEALVEEKTRLKNQYADEYASYSEMVQKEKNEQAEAMAKSAQLVREAQDEHKRLLKLREQLKMDIEAKDRQRSELKDELEKIESSAWEGETICPTCGQELQAEKVQEAKE
uniref:hypothetical protein n=1 Tax=Escherichia coli TaxID=562 RepID=UPI00185E868A